MKHKCLTCDGRIEPGQEEVEVPSKYNRPSRFRHMNYEDCSTELRPRSLTAEALRKDRLNATEGRRRPLPALEDMEGWD